MKTIFYSSGKLCKQLTLLFLFGFFLQDAKAQPDYSIFTTSEGPALVNQNDNGISNPLGSIECGIRFQSKVSGTIKGIRFYKGDQDNGIHIGNLWTNNGITPIASAEFVNETSDGWQEVVFASPVFISANTTYVASYFSSAGYYVATANECNPHNDPNIWVYERGPLIVLEHGIDGDNGIYRYTTEPTFPTVSYNFSNYWVDVVFTPTFPLPVSLVSLTAQSVGTDVILDWKTQSEQNNKGFEVQRSNNAKDWYALSFINGAGESNITRNYNYNDRKLAPGTYYYRLRQVDFDGKEYFSQTTMASIDGRGSILLHQNAPNPFKASTTIRFDLPSAQKIRLSLWDLSGREVRVLSDSKRESGTHLVSLDAAGLSPQIYYLRLVSDNGIFTKKIVVE